MKIYITESKMFFNENVNDETIEKMKEYGLDENYIDNDGYVELYHGGKKLPDVLTKGHIFYMTHDFDEAKHHAEYGEGDGVGKVFKIKVKADDVTWNIENYEVEYDKGGYIIDGKIVSF